VRARVCAWVRACRWGLFFDYGECRFKKVGVMIIITE